MADTRKKEIIVEVTEKDLPLHCPTPDTPKWNLHPRVFLDVVDAGTIRCPYCSTVYKFVGKPPTTHH